MRVRNRRWKLTLAVAAVVALLAPLVAAAPASAGNGVPYCGIRCNYKNPQTYKYYPWLPQLPEAYLICADSNNTATLATAPTPWGPIDLRYSNWCETTWGRWHDGDVGGWWAMPRLETYNGTTVKTLYGRTASGWWGPMLDKHGWLSRFCLVSWIDENAYSDGLPPYETYCTNWV